MLSSRSLVRFLSGRKTIEDSTITTAASPAHCDDHSVDGESKELNDDDAFMQKYISWRFGTQSPTIDFSCDNNNDDDDDDDDDDETVKHNNHCGERSSSNDSHNNNGANSDNNNATIQEVSNDIDVYLMESLSQQSYINPTIDGVDNTVLPTPSSTFNEVSKEIMSGIGGREKNTTSNNVHYCIIRKRQRQCSHASSTTSSNQSTATVETAEICSDSGSVDDAEIHEDEPEEEAGYGKCCGTTSSSSHRNNKGMQLGTKSFEEAEYYNDDVVVEMEPTLDDLIIALNPPPPPLPPSRMCGACIFIERFISMNEEYVK